MKSIKFFLYLFFLTASYAAQSPSCPSNSIYIHSISSVSLQAVSPVGTPNLLLNNMPMSSGGLAIGPSLGFGVPGPTFWTVSGGTLWYYTGSVWVNTTHSINNGAAVNLGAGGSRLYCLAGSTGQVYAYDGTGTASLITTVSNFGGPYDIVADENDNFYLLRTTTGSGQVQMLSIYDPSGTSLCNYTLANVPSASSGGGFAILNNTVFNTNNGGLVGTIVPGNSTISFSTQALTYGTDYANCALPVPTGTILAPAGGTLDCNVNTVQLVAEVVPGGIGMDPGPSSSTLTSTSYTWSGPGIISGQGTASVSVNLPGVYTFTVHSSGCPVQRVVRSFSVTSGLSFSPIISAPACFSGTTQLSVSPISPTNNVLWAGPGIVGSSNKDSVIINTPGIYSVSISNTLGCVGAATVNILQSPTLGISLSSNTICAQNLNGSPTSLTITPSGASVYTLLTTTNYSTALLGPWVSFPIGPPSTNISLASATLIGSTGICSNTVVATFTILPNPIISITPSVSSVCLGAQRSFTATGASNYVWLPGLGLNTYTGNSVVANAMVTTVYSAYGTSGGCNSATQANTLTILPIPSLLATPATATVCQGNSAMFTAIGSAATYTWFPSGITGSTLSVNPGVSSTYTVRGSLNSCTNVATVSVTVVAPPLLGMTLSSNSLCAQGYNGSPNSIAVTPLGASFYTLLTTPNCVVASPFGPVMTIQSTGLPSLFASAATATLLGSNGYCTVSASQSFSIIPNPIVVSTPGIASICQGNSQVFTASGATSYSWSTTGSGLSANTGSSVVVNPTVSTVYSIVGSSVGCNSATQSNILNVLSVPTISLSASSPTICAGNNVTLNATGNSVFYTWLPSGGLSAITGASVVANPTVTQTYTVTGSNTCTNSAVVTVSVIPKPSLSLSAAQYTVCRGANAYLYVNGANSYNWAPATGINPVIGPNIVATPGNTTTFTVWGFNGICTGSASLRIETIPLPDISINASANQICPGASLTLMASGADNLIWSPSGSLSSSTGSMVFASPVSNTNYTIVGINKSGTVSCSQQVSYSVMVQPTTVAKVSANKAICAGQRVGLTASGGDTFIWAPGTGLNKTSGGTVLANPSASTTYTVHVSNNGFCGSSATVAVAVNPNPEVYAGRDTTFNLDQDMQLSATGTGTLSWVAGEGILCRDCPLTAIKPRNDECYVVEAVNKYGCKAKDQVCVILTNEYNIYIPNSFTPNNDGLNDVFFVYGTGISDISLNIYDRWGEQLFESKSQLTGWDGTFRGVNCNPGVYIYSISYKGLDNKKLSKTGHVIITR